MQVTWNENTVYRLVTCLVMAALVLMPQLAFAGSTGVDLDSIMAGGGTAGGGGLCSVVRALTGTTGRAIATIGIIILGIGAFFGKVNWGLAILVGIGVISIFAAASIVGGLGATGGTC